MAKLTLAQLEKKRKQLMALKEKQEKISRERYEKQRREIQLKNEIRKLKEETGTGARRLLKKYKEIKDSPKTKYYGRQAKAVSKHLQRFVNKYGTK